MRVRAEDAPQHTLQTMVLDDSVQRLLGDVTVVNTYFRLLQHRTLFNKGIAVIEVLEVLQYFSTLHF